MNQFKIIKCVSNLTDYKICEHLYMEDSSLENLTEQILNVLLNPQLLQTEIEL